MVAVTITNGFRVSPKIAGIESKAKTRLVIATAVSAITEIDKPLLRINRRARPSRHSSSSLSRNSFTAV